MAKKKLDQTLEEENDQVLDNQEQEEEIVTDEGEVNDEVGEEEEEEVSEEDGEVVEEETAAAATLHPGAKSISDPKALSSSKIGAMQGVMGLMNGMNKSDAIAFFNQVMGQFGPGKTYGVGDNSEKNKKTLKMKPSSAPGGSWDVKMPTPKLKEDVEAMFEGEELSEDFKEKATTLFDAAVSARLIAETARLEEQYDSLLEEKVAEITSELAEQLDSYLSYVTENWMAENEVAIESTLRNELMEEFIDGMKNLFAEHYIDVPSDKVDVVEALAQKVEVLESELTEAIDKVNELSEEIVDTQREKLFSELASDLALTQQEKFADLAEGIEFDGNLETYEKKLKIIKESYFSKKKEAPSTNIEEETFEGDTGVTTVTIDPQINKYIQAITRTVKK